MRLLIVAISFAVAAVFADSDISKTEEMDRVNRMLPAYSQTYGQPYAQMPAPGYYYQQYPPHGDYLGQRDTWQRQYPVYGQYPAYGQYNPRYDYGRAVPTGYYDQYSQRDQQHQPYWSGYRPDGAQGGRTYVGTSWSPNWSSNRYYNNPQAGSYQREETYNRQYPAY